MFEEIVKYEETYLQGNTIRYKIYIDSDELVKIELQEWHSDVKRWITSQNISFMQRFAEQIGQVLIDKFKQV